MNTIELLKIIALGKTSTVQFKELLDNDTSIAAEMIAMSNAIRLFQQSGILYTDELIVPHTSIDDIDYSKVAQYIATIQTQEDEEEKEITKALLKNLNILRNEQLTLGGLVFFGKKPQRYRPAFCIKAVSFFGNSIGGTDYRDSKDIIGTIPEMFEASIRFFTSNLHAVQAGQNFNSIGKLEISQIALEELLQNALVHRDYSKNAPIRIMIFDNRIEIVSPCTLPNQQPRRRASGY